jgi:hypothetical protein
MIGPGYKKNKTTYRYANPAGNHYLQTMEELGDLERTALSATSEEIESGKRITDSVYIK